MQEEKFSRYEIKVELGQGGMATVFRAYDPLFEREVALKILKRELLDNSQIRERFERETKIIARLEHPAIVPVYDVGRDKDQLFYVMRYMTGGSLSDRLTEQPMPLAEALHIIQRVASALDYAHARGVIHRDLKPGNILFDSDGNAFISDFGIAKLAHAQTKLTNSGIIGTPTYMSPEQALGEDVDGRSDIYSLGIILFELLSGKLPYEATTPLAMVVKHVNDPVPHILDLNPNLPDGIEPILEKALAKNRNFRYEQASNLVADLAKLFPGGLLADQQFTVPVPARLPQPAPKPAQPANQAGWFIAGLVGIMALLGLGAWIYPKFVPPVSTITPTLTVTDLVRTTLAPPIETVAPTVTITPSPTPTETPTVTPTLPIAGVGGADKIALLTNKDIWLMDIDGQNPMQVTNSDQNKFDLQWLPGGVELLYGEGRCVNTVNVDTLEITRLTCLESPYFEGFRVSPDGSKVAISIERRVVIVPFDRAALSEAKITFDLQNLENACLDYSEVSAKNAQWSADGTKLAILYQNIWGKRLADIIRVINVSRCKAADPLILDEFPAKRFTPDGYETYPVLPAYDWNGGQQFLFNTFKRNLGYGQLYLYDMFTNQVKMINPIENKCCYRDARFSPDGSHILVVFQDAGKGADGETELYYLPVDQLGSGTKFQALKLPPLFFPNAREEIAPALRPAGP